MFYPGPATGYKTLVFNQYFSECSRTFVLLAGIYAVVRTMRNVGFGANV